MYILYEVSHKGAVTDETISNHCSDSNTEEEEHEETDDDKDALALPVQSVERDLTEEAQSGGRNRVRCASFIIFIFRCLCGILNWFIVC